MTARRPLALERLRHVPGELLRSRDLRDEVAGEAELLWWHQRALHDVPGVVTGLLARTRKGSPVLVSAGMAYDPRGRELILTREATIERPTGDFVLLLVLRRGGDRAPELAWVQPARLGRCEGVVLARWDPQADPVLRPAGVRARSTARPRIASGSTLPGATAWAPSLGLQRAGLGNWLEVRVDTRAAGFASIPCYFAWLQWPRAGSPDARPAYRVFGIQHLAEERADGFTFRVLMQLPVPSGPGLVVTGGAPADEEVSTQTHARTQRLSVAWLALEGDHDRRGGA